MDKKLIVFLRHNNDIDHITPVLWKWLKTTDIPVEVYITTNRKLLYDYRINMLKGFDNCKIKFITDDFKKLSIPNLYIHYYDKYYTPIDKYVNKYGYIKNKVDNGIKKIADNIFKEDTDSVVVFDWVINYFVEQMIQHAHTRGYPVVSLPHGDAPYINQLETIGQISFDNLYDKSDKYVRSHLHSLPCMDMFDKVVVPNWIVARRYKHLQDDKVKTLGSPRYCDEWMDLVKTYVPVYPNKFTGFRAVMFLRNICYPIYWDGVGEAIKLLLQFPDTYLIVKPHARARRDNVVVNRILYKYPELKKQIPDRLIFADMDSNALSLVKWADVVLDLGTSMIWEPVKNNKPVLCLDYLHSNISTVSHYITNCSITTRDKLFQSFDKLHNEDRMDNFYNPGQRENFIREVIEPNGKDVLMDYVGFLKEMF